MSGYSTEIGDISRGRNILQGLGIFVEVGDIRQRSGIFVEVGIFYRDWGYSWRSGYST
jgi:hypothetical protein